MMSDLVWASVAAALTLVWVGRAEGQDLTGLRTRWAAHVDPDAPLPEYPRPMMVRPEWTNLNGRWDYAITPAGADRPETWDGRIVVPFCVESALSGVEREVGPERALWYRRSFDAPAIPPGGRLLLHFGAVDWEATVWLNGTRVGDHRGGYDPFSFDITDSTRTDALNELVVRVWDPSDAGPQPRGKQVRRPGGIWYTAVTGIWQTVWLEPVPATSIRALRIDTAIQPRRVDVFAAIAGEAREGDRVRVRAGATGPVADGPAGLPLRLALDERFAELWTPDSPRLHDLTVELVRGGRTIDSVTSYFALRTIEVRPDAEGIDRLWLNGEVVFQLGPLDQGWWPDGLYTAPTDEALRYDIEVTRELGFNMCRKHVKIEPQRWYSWCDRLGLLVWQDMPSGDGAIGGDQPDLVRSPRSEAIFRNELAAMVEHLRNHPSIVAWVPFNEGWGQFKTNEILALTKRLDPSRLVDGPSGWTDRGEGDMLDLHAYPGPAMLPPTRGRASVLGEFGGLGLAVPGHLWRTGDNWGYRSFESPEALAAAYEERIDQLRPLIARGLAAAVYTQTTDVEIEVNGLLTYDRALVKMDAARVRNANRRVHLPPPITTVFVPTSEAPGPAGAQRWRYTTDAPLDGWTAAEFDDSSWREGPGGFGTAGTPGAVVRTTWDTREIWIRREFELAEAPGDGLRLRLHHDEDAEVYIDGALVLSRTGYVTAYTDVPLDAETIARLGPGRHVIAIHCRQTRGGQYIDAGLVRVRER